MRRTSIFSKYSSFVKFSIFSFPRLFVSNLFVLLIMGLLESASIFSFAPLIEYFQDPNGINNSRITKSFSKFLEFINIEPNLVNFVVLFILIFVLKNLFGILAQYLSLKIKYELIQKMISDSFSTFFRAAWPFFVNKKQGDILGALTTQVGRVGDALGTFYRTIRDFIKLIFAILVLSSLSFELTICSLGIFFVIYMISFFSGRISYRLGAEDTRTSNNLVQSIQELFSLAKIIIGFSIQEKSIKHLNTSIEEHKNITIKAQIIPSIIQLLYEPFYIAAIFSIMYYSNSILKNPIAESLTFMYGLKVLGPLVVGVVHNFNYLQNTIPSYELIEKLKQEAINQKIPTGTNKLQSFQDKIELKNVHYSYESNIKVLDNINLEIKKGEFIAIVGKSGSGKSTLIDLLLGLISPQSGTVIIDNNELTNIDPHSYRSQIGYVPQDAAFFNMTIEENFLMLGNEYKESIAKACEISQSKEFIDQLKKSYRSPMGHQGQRFSGGQRQRLALARALYRDPNILILDEATSALDSKSENLIQDAINGLAKKKTLIVVAHRLSTIKNADKIIVLDNGKIIEQGSFQELINTNGVFYDFTQQQGLS
jgi:ABC-type multidrug transport system fused ATPase/permease subunit